MVSPSEHRLLPGMLFTLAAAIGFACSLVMARLSYEYGSDAQTVMLLRFIAMLTALLLWNFLRGQTLKLKTRDCAGSLLCGLLYFVGIFSYLSSVAWLPVSLSVLIFYTFPILVAIISALMIRHRPNLLSMFALLIAFVGLLLALDVESAEVSKIGLGFAICAAIGIALNLVLSGQVLQRVETQVFSTYTAAVSALLASLVVFFSGGLSLPAGVVGWAAFCGMLVSFFVGFICTFNAISRLGSVRFASLMNLEPVATIILAMLLLGETLNSLQVAGAFIVIAGVILAQYAAKRHQTGT